MTPCFDIIRRRFSRRSYENKPWLTTSSDVPAGRQRPRGIVPKHAALCPAGDGRTAARRLVLGTYGVIQNARLYIAG